MLVTCNWNGAESPEHVPKDCESVNDVVQSLTIELAAKVIYSRLPQSPSVFELLYLHVI